MKYSDLRGLSIVCPISVLGCVSPIIPILHIKLALEKEVHRYQHQRRGFDHSLPICIVYLRVAHQFNMQCVPYHGRTIHRHDMSLLIVQWLLLKHTDNAAVDPTEPAGMAGYF